MNNPNPMSAAEYWWNHLTHEQKEYCRLYASNFGVLADSHVIINAYNKQQGAYPWNNEQGWPETPRSTFTGV